VSTPTPPTPTPKKLLANFNDLNAKLLNIKRHKKQTFVEVELERVFRINCRFIDLNAKAKTNKNFTESQISSFLKFSSSSSLSA